MITSSLERIMVSELQNYEMSQAALTIENSYTSLL